MPHKDPLVARTYAREQARRVRRVGHMAALESKRQWVEDRPRWPDIDLAWAAGMFEGEGTATISVTTNRVGNPSGRCVISLTSTDRQIIDFFHERWPASKIGTRHADPRHKLAWVWVLQGDMVLRFVADVSRFLRTDAERAKFEIVERAQWLRRKGNRDDAVKGRAC